MKLTEVQVAGLAQALATLEATPDWKLPMSIIRRNGGDEVVDAINRLHGEYVNANKAATSPTAFLSASSVDYWQEARKVLAYGRLALSMGSRSAEKQLGKKCEALDESFDARVPDEEKGAFQIHDINDPSTWDDRWHNCVDFNFPLLRESMLGGVPVIDSPMRQAQLDVLSGIVHPIIVLADPEEESARSERVAALSERLKSIVREDQSGVAKTQKAAAKKAKSDAHKAKVAAGDQQATRGIRGRELKPVNDLLCDGSGNHLK